jgi:hypothetical protein
MMDDHRPCRSPATGARSIRALETPCPKRVDSVEKRLVIFGEQ